MDRKVCDVKAYRFRVYPTKSQDEVMRKHLWIAKELWNDLLAHTKFMYNAFGRFPTMDALQRMAKNTGLFSQTAQGISHRIHTATFRFLKLKRKGIKVGFPRFKSLDRMKSLNYPQYGTGFTVGSKLNVTPFGPMRIVKHRRIIGTIKTLSLKRESTGKWFAGLTVEEPPLTPRANNGEEVGIDVGLKSFARLSNDTEIPNPQHYERHEGRLAKAQHKLSNKKRGSKNRRRAKLKVAKIYEKIRDARVDFLHKNSTMLVNKYSLIGLEDLSVRNMTHNGLGKFIYDAGWSRFASMLRYKAENAGCKVIFVDPKGTTKTCHRCNHTQNMPLTERTYNCPKCGLVMDRDLNASKVILARATLGHSGSNAPGDGAKAPSLNGGAPTLLGMGVCHVVRWCNSASRTLLAYGDGDESRKDWV